MAGRIMYGVQGKWLNGQWRNNSCYMDYDVGWSSYGLYDNLFNAVSTYHSLKRDFANRTYLFRIVKQEMGEWGARTVGIICQSETIN